MTDRATPVAREASPRRRDDVRSWLLALVLAVAVPLLVVQAWLLIAIRGDARARELADLDSQARLVALRLEDFAGELSLALNLARDAARPDERYAAQNDTSLRRVAVELPAYITSLSIYSADGRNLGHSSLVENPRQRSTLLVADRRYFREALRRDGLAIGEPVVGRITSAFVVGAGRAVRDTSGTLLYVQATTTLVARLRELLVVPSLGARSRVRLVDSTGALVAATDVPADSASRGLSAVPADSTEMLLARAPVANAPWTVVVETPLSAVSGASRGRLQLFIVTALLVLVLAAALALALARRIATPLLALGVNVRAMTAPPYAPAPVHPTGPRVVRDLARAFNEMAALVARRTAELERSERQYRLVTDGVPLLIGYVDAARAVRFLNRRAEEFVGRPLADVAGHPFAELFHLADDSPIVAALTAALDGKDAETEARLDRADGRALEVDCTCVPHRDDGARVDGAFVLIADVTASRRLESQLRQAQRMDAVGRLAGGIAHDFNNLLTVILSNLEFALEEARKHPDAHAITADLRTARESGERAATLTRQLLTYTRQKSGAREPLELNDVARAAEQMLRRLIGEQITMHLQLGADLWPVRADRSQLEQVLVNLVVNARDAMPGGGQLTIETRNVELDGLYASQHPNLAPGEYVCLEVTDTGSGIAPEVLPHIFEPFFTTKGVGEGTGLGLAVCYGIVQQHGGRISAYSEPGKGTTFKVLLPRGTEPASGPSLPSTLDPAGGHETILLVEDDDAVRRTARRALEERGYTVLVAEDGQAALALMAGPHEHVDLLVTDFVMPGLSGVELAAELRVKRPGLKVLVVSGYARSGMRSATGIPEGMPYLAKPYTARTLCAKVRELIDGRIDEG